MRIGELAAEAGTTTKTLRFYEASGLLPPAERTSGGYRDYPADSVARLDFIRGGRTAGFTLAQVREVLDLRDAGHAPCHHVQGLLVSRLDALTEQIANLLALRDCVADLHAAAVTADPETCPADAVCRYL